MAKEYQKCVVSFVDILGFRDKIERENANDIFDSLDVLRRTTEINGSDVRFFAFSDSVVRVRQIGDSIEEAIGLEAYDLGLAQLALMHKGVFLRGGISVGEIFADEDKIFGPALVAAYDVESKISQAPRIVVDPAIEHHLGVRPRSFKDDQYNFTNNFMNATPRERVWVDYLFIGLEDLDDDADVLETMKVHKLEIESALLQFANSPRVRPKYIWLARYHNAFCMRFFPYIDAQKLLVVTGLSLVEQACLRSRMRIWYKRPYGHTHEVERDTETDGEPEEDGDYNVLDDDFGGPFDWSATTTRDENYTSVAHLVSHEDFHASWEAHFTALLVCDGRHAYLHEALNRIVSSLDEPERWQIRLFSGTRDWVPKGAKKMLRGDILDKRMKLLSGVTHRSGTEVMGSLDAIAKRQTLSARFSLSDLDEPVVMLFSRFDRPKGHLFVFEDGVDEARLHIVVQSLIQAFAPSRSKYPAWHGSDEVNIASASHLLESQLDFIVARGIPGLKWIRRF